jgi:hypothetical protein
MSLLEETEKMVDDLFKYGSTNNKQLFDLLSNLKIIAESRVTENRLTEDFNIFFSQYLSTLAMNWLPSSPNISKERNERLIGDIECKLVDCMQSARELNDSIVNEWDKKIQLEYLFKMEQIVFSSFQDLKMRIEFEKL